MAMPAAEIKAWLSGFNDDEEIGIDDGGLALRAVKDQECYLEIGGTLERIALTDEEKKAYLEKPFGCPVCHSEEVNMGSIQGDGSVAWADNECPSCGFLWDDIFTLTDIKVKT